MLVVASVNGAMREAWLIPAIGDVGGRAVSTLSLCVLIVLVTYLTIRWIHPRSVREAWLIGGVWVASTLAFEFLGGHFLFGTPWHELLEDYDVPRGRIWVLVLFITLCAPRVCARLRGLLPPAA
jgi:hypothetical protein